MLDLTTQIWAHPGTELRVGLRRLLRPWGFVMEGQRGKDGLRRHAGFLVSQGIG